MKRKAAKKRVLADYESALDPAALLARLDIDAMVDRPLDRKRHKACRLLSVTDLMNINATRHVVTSLFCMLC